MKGSELLLAVGIAGNVANVVLFAVPIVTFKRVISKRSTEEFSVVPYVLTLLVSLLYTWYGLPLVSYKWTNLTVVTINGAGVIFESAFILIYIWFASARRKGMAILMVVATIMVFSITALVSVFSFHDHHRRTLLVGSIVTVITIGMYGSPLVVVKQVIKTKSVEFMPFNLSFWTFINCVLWGLYGVVARDPFIWVPNGVGLPLSIVQLVLFCIYRKAGIHEEPSDTDLEKNIGKKTELIQQQPGTTKE